jgi:hypothetical protein
MQKQPSMFLVRFFCLCNPKAFLLCDEDGRSVLHLVVIYLESLELLQSMVQIDPTMTNKKVADTSPAGAEVDTALGLLCKRLGFPSFKEMVNSLIQVDCFLGVVCDGIRGCMMSNGNSLCQNIVPGSGSENTFDLISLRFFWMQI